MEKILISSCFLGNKVRYDGKAKAIAHPQISTWQQQGRLVIVCPEVAGGLPIPRAKAEQQGSRVINNLGQDVSVEFNSGADVALQLCRQHNIRYALLKEYSPSCGSHEIYDGNFTGTKILGQGVTAKLLSANNVEVFSELNIEQLIAKITH